MKKIYCIYSLSAIFLLLLLNCHTFLPHADGNVLETAYAEAFEFFRNEDHVECLKKLDRILKQDKEHTKARILRAIIHEERKEYNAALADYNIVLRHDTTNYLAFFNRGNVHVGRGDFAAAINSYTQCIELNSQFAAAYLNRANAQMHLKEYAGALADYKVYVTKSDKQKINIGKVITLLENAASSPVVE